VHRTAATTTHMSLASFLSRSARRTTSGWLLARGITDPRKEIGRNQKIVVEHVTLDGLAIQDQLAQQNVCSLARFPGVLRSAQAGQCVPPRRSADATGDLAMS